MTSVKAIQGLGILSHLADLGTGGGIMTRYSDSMRCPGRTSPKTRRNILTTMQSIGMI
jgi:hypothetical protein